MDTNIKWRRAFCTKTGHVLATVPYASKQELLDNTKDIHPDNRWLGEPFSYEEDRQVISTHQIDLGHGTLIVERLDPGTKEVKH